MSTAIAVDSRAKQLADAYIELLETGVAPDGLLAPDVFCDFTMPHWRLQSRGADELVAMRRVGHPAPGRVVRSRLDETTTGFVLEVEERWEDAGGHWYCRELFRADV